MNSDDDSTTFRAIFNNSLDAILLTDPAGEIVLANPAACRLLGRTQEEIRRVGRSGLLDSTDPRLAAGLEQRARTGRFAGELSMLRPDGTSFPVEVTSAVFTTDAGAARTCTVIRDLTERKAADAAMAKVHRLDALRELSAGLRHELNNSLTALRGEIQLLQQSRTTHAEDREGLAAALKLVDRITATTKRLVRVEDLDSVDYLGVTRMLDVSPEP
ncbi:MAG: PAS domain S-box protein [Cytophagaceae bacterium]|nr:PAS domain S-box protein [Gemmatimonadaceae bacterium]